MAEPVGKENALESHAGFKDSLILMVEDNTENQVLIEALFDEMDLTIQFADNGRQGVEKILQLMEANTPPDLIFMDIHMPVMNGLEAAREIRRNPECREIPIVALSADAFSEQQAEAQAAGMNDYLTKPINVVELRAMINKYLKETT